MLLPAGSYFIAGGAGFIGSHFTDALLASSLTRRVTLFDNFSSGREWHFAAHTGDPRLQVIRADAGDVQALAATMEGHDWVIHLASNPNIAAAVDNPEIDFYRGTLLTNNVVEAMRRSNVRRLTALLVAPGDERAFAACLSVLLDDPNIAARLSAAGRRHAEMRFSLATQTAALEDLYDEVLHTRVPNLPVSGLRVPALQ